MQIIWPSVNLSGLKGRILADEVLTERSGDSPGNNTKNMDYVHSLPGMEVWFKIDEENEQAFKKMFVRTKKVFTLVLKTMTLTIRH